MFRQALTLMRGEAGSRFAALVLCLITVSAVWVESDAYRYSTGILLLFALNDYRRTPRNERPEMSWVGLACLAWAAYVALRFGWVMLRDPGKHGSAEGLYLFPLVFMTLGYAFYRMRTWLDGLPDLFMMVSVVMLAATVDFGAVFAGERTPFLFQNNTIHASVAAGLILISTFSYIENAVRNASARPRAEQALRLILALAVVALCLLGIFGAKSKGVWLALAFTLPLQALASLVQLPRRHAFVIGATTLLAVTVALFAASTGLLRELTPHLASALALVDASRIEGLDAVREAIAAGTVPFSFNERLKLWMNALQILFAHPLFGAGISWEREWAATAYADVPYHLMHNGFVEIAIRYGLSGLLFFAILWGIFASWVLRAWQKRLIAPTAAKTWVFTVLFFALTLLTNSNNRLAIGETLILISAGYAFSLYYLSQSKVAT